MKKQYSEIRELEELINKESGSNLLMSLVADSKKKLSGGVSSGSFMLNKALSGSPMCGYIMGRIVEIYGPESSGKTTLALNAIREAQKMNLLCGFVDAEHALDINYAQFGIGVDIRGLSICQPDTGEQALDVVEKMINNGYRMIVVDSVAALVPKAELEGEMGDAHIGRQARLMGQAMRKLSGKVSKSKALVIFTNQLRMKVGVMFGNPETTPGGNALKFYASYRLDIRSPRGGAVTDKSLDGGTEVGIGSKIKIVKNKLYPPYRTAEVFMRYGKGIDRIHDAVMYLESEGLFVPSGKKGKQLMIRVNDKAYTVNTLMKAMQEEGNISIRKGVLKIIKELNKPEIEE